MIDDIAEDGSEELEELEDEVVVDIGARRDRG